MDQRERIERTKRMVGDDDDAPFHRNVFAIGIGDAVAQLQEFDRALDEGETDEALRFGEERIDAFLAGDAAKQLDDGPRQLARTAFGKTRESFVKAALDADHGIPPVTEAR